MLRILRNIRKNKNGTIMFFDLKSGSSNCRKPDGGDIFVPSFLL
nr:MAG TPA: hypothetical protein [Caudoviricetes sp.]